MNIILKKGVVIGCTMVGTLTRHHIIASKYNDLKLRVRIANMLVENIIDI